MVPERHHCRSPPQEGWARHYDRVLERTFGASYRALTERTLAEIRALVEPPARIVDFGAGTGRLAVPLARAGYRVTAVDPAAAMLGRLAEKPGAEAVERVVSGLESYPGTAGHDLALCVFTVVAYLLDEETLTAGMRAVASSLAARGRLLLEIPTPAVFEGLEVESEDVIRCVEIEPDPAGPDLLRYREHTAVRVEGARETYHEEFLLRRWRREEVEGALSEAGFALERDLSPGFRRWGAEYLVLRLAG